MKKGIFLCSVILLVLSFSKASASEPTATCSNNKYSTATQDLPTYPESKGIALTPESQSKLKEAVSTNGNAALKEINDLTCLEYLNLNDFAISDLNSIKNLVNLKELYLSNTDVSDLLPLTNFANLKHLALYSDTKKAKFSDLAPLSNLENLETLLVNIENVSIIDPLQSLTNLKTLSIKNYKDEHNISRLKKLKLESLEISKPSVIKNVSDFTKLIRIKKLSFTDVDVDCNLIKQALPEATVDCAHSMPDSVKSNPTEQKVQKPVVTAQQLPNQKISSEEQTPINKLINLLYWIIGSVVVIVLGIFILILRKKEKTNL